MSPPWACAVFNAFFRRALAGADKIDEPFEKLTPLAIGVPASRGRPSIVVSRKVVPSRRFAPTVPPSEIPTLFAN